MVDQARWWYIVKLPEVAELCYEGKRLLFYWHVLKWQLNDIGFKRVYFNDGVFKMFCGTKKLNIAEEEAKIILWSLYLKGENNGKKRFVRVRER